MKKNLIKLLIFFSLSNFISASGFLKTNNRIIINENNEKVILKGFGLGGWTVLEGYMWNAFIEHASTTNLENAIVDLVGVEKKDQFFELYQKNYITEKDIVFLSEQGFNALRVPLHYKHFSPLPNVFTNEGFDLLDPIVELCKENNIYLILDMHAAPGAQNTNDFSDSDGETAKLFTEYENQVWLASTWRYIAEYYADEPIIGAYDLLNEPVIPWGYGPELLKNIYVRSIDSIRTVDPNHIVIIEGNWYGNDHTGLLPPFDDEMVYSFHHYIGSSADTNWIHQYTTNLSHQYDVPLWIGEFGENSNSWAYNKINLFESNNIGWSWWNYKSVERISSLLSYRINEDYQKIIDYWSGSSSKPDTSIAFNGLMTMANSIHIDSCQINRGLIRALIDTTYNSEKSSYANFNPPGLLPAVNYDIGNNNVSYYDNQVEDPSKFSPETKSWNNGWSYRNDGVDIGITYTNNKKDYFVGWIDDNEWMSYTINPLKPGNFELLAEVASFSNGTKLSVEINDSLISGPINLPNTNGWSSGWRIVKIGNVTIQDETVLKIKAEVGGFNLKNLIFSDLDVSSIPMNLNLNCYPNPTNSTLTIDWMSEFALDTEIKIYNVLGKLMLEKSVISLKGANSLDWYLGSKDYNLIPSGIYIIEVKTINSSNIKKITYLK